MQKSLNLSQKHDQNFYYDHVVKNTENKRKLIEKT